jgi:hypothetical protein
LLSVAKARPTANRMAKAGKTSFENLVFIVLRIRYECLLFF